MASRVSVGKASAKAAKRGPEPALADQARARLEELIVTLELPPGSVWSEQQLSETIGIGRTPVREALQRLQSDYLVRILPRLGAQVTEINVSQQLLLLELRRVLERLIAGDAARRATPEEREALLGMADALEALVDADVLKYLRYHYDIKKYIAELRAQSVRRQRGRAAARDVAALLLPPLPQGARPAGGSTPPRRRDPRHRPRRGGARRARRRTR